MAVPAPHPRALRERDARPRRAGHLHARAEGDREGQGARRRGRAAEEAHHLPGRASVQADPPLRRARGHHERGTAHDRAGAMGGARCEARRCAHRLPRRRELERSEEDERRLPGGISRHELAHVRAGRLHAPAALAAPHAADHARVVECREGRRRRSGGNVGGERLVEVEGQARRQISVCQLADRRGPRRLPPLLRAR